MIQNLTSKLFRMAPIGLFVIAQACNFGLAPNAFTSPEKVQNTLSSADLSTTATASAGMTDTSPSATAAPPTATATATVTPTPKAITYPLGPDTFPANVNPLTGLAVSDPALLLRRPIAVKVANFPRNARPQAGLSKADILFEWYTEFGDTRFMGLFYGQNAAKVGPIRSLRIQDFSFLPLYNAVLVYIAGYAPVIQRMNIMGIEGVQELGVGSNGAMWRDDDTVNGVFADTAKMSQYIQRIGIDPGTQPEMSGLTFDPKPPTGYASSIGIRMVFSQAAFAEWKYDPEQKRYMRSSEDEAGKMKPLVDRMTNTQLAVDNLAVLLVPWTRCFVAGATGELWEFHLEDSGLAYFYRDGMVRLGQWKSGGSHAPLRFLEEDGKPYMLHPGTSYITVIPYLKGIPLDTIRGILASTQYQFNGNPNVRITSEWGEKKSIVPNDTHPC
jgi:hypothetical protein